MDVAKGDLIIGSIIVMMAAAIGYPFVSDMMSGDSKIVRQCKADAKAAQENSTLRQWGAKCSCVPPDQVNQERYSVADKVDNATDIYLIKCTLNDDAPLKSPVVLPVRRVVNASGLNASAVNGTQVLNESSSFK